MSNDQQLERKTVPVTNFAIVDHSRDDFLTQVRSSFDTPFLSEALHLI